MPQSEPQTVYILHFYTVEDDTPSHPTNAYPDIALIKIVHYMCHLGLNIIFNLIQEVLYICPEFRTILLWGGSTMRFCILCRHDIAKAVIPTAAPFLK